MLTGPAMLFSAASRVRRTLKAPDMFVNGGMPVTNAGVLSVIDATPTLYCNGLGYDVTTGALCASSVGPIAFYSSGMPFMADGRLFMSTNPATRFQNGLPFSLVNTLSSETLE